MMDLLAGLILFGVGACVVFPGAILALSGILASGICFLQWCERIFGRLLFPRR